MNARITRRCAGLALIAVAVASLSAQQPDQKKGDPALEGKWNVVTLTEGGKEVKDAPVSVMTFEFKADKLTMKIVDKAKSYGFRAEPGKDGGKFEMDGGGKTALGIYKIEKDALTLCFDDARDKGARPEKFESPAGSSVVLVVLKRVEVVAAKKEGKGGNLPGGPARAVSQNNLKQIALAFHNYHDTQMAMPAHAIYSKDGKPLLSWRVSILPYIEQQPLYNQFKLDEPWDSAHNKKLLAQMPEVYAPVGGVKPKEPNSTFYQVFTGPQTPFDGDKKLQLQRFTDGTSNTLLVVEAGEAVPWTKPADLKYDPKGPLPKLGGLFKGAFNGALADGSVRMIRGDVDSKILRAIITPNGGEVVDFNQLD